MFDWKTNDFFSSSSSSWRDEIKLEYIHSVNWLIFEFINIAICECAIGIWSKPFADWPSKCETSVHAFTVQCLSNIFAYKQMKSLAHTRLAWIILFRLRHFTKTVATIQSSKLCACIYLYGYREIEICIQLYAVKRVSIYMYLTVYMWLNGFCVDFGMFMIASIIVSIGIIFHASFSLPSLNSIIHFIAIRTQKEQSVECSTH